jgi:hypothetical protein
VGNRFPPPTSLKQLDVLQEKWYIIPLEAVQNFYESIPRRTAAVLKAKGGPTPYLQTNLYSICSVSIILSYLFIERRWANFVYFNNHDYIIRYVYI